jgi:hypothetical protein
MRPVALAVCCLALAQMHGIKDRDAVLKTMTGALDAITNEAVAK